MRRETGVKVRSSIASRSGYEVKNKEKILSSRIQKDQGLVPKRRMSKQLQFVKRLLLFSIVIFVIIFAVFIAKLDFSIPQKTIEKALDLSDKMNICSDMAEIQKGAVANQLF